MLLLYQFEKIRNSYAELYENQYEGMKTDVEVTNSP